MNKILVIGSTNIDMIACVKHLPRPGETVGEARFMQSNGGKGANQAVAAARLGGDVAFVSCLGDDAGAAALRQQFAADGINTEALFTAKDTPTGTALIFVSQDGENCIAVAPGANHSLTCEAIDAVADRIAGAEYLLVQLEIPMETVACAIEKAYAAGTRVVLNPAPAMPLVDELLRKVYLITPNRTESETLTGIPVHTVQDASKAAGALLAKGVGNVIVTLGSEGALIRRPRYRGARSWRPSPEPNENLKTQILCSLLTATLWQSSSASSRCSAGARGETPRNSPARPGVTSFSTGTT